MREKVLTHPVYFGPISLYATLLKFDTFVFENDDNFQKQTYRNRIYIYDANGPLLLNIPIKHKSSLSNVKPEGKQKYRDVFIDNSFEWQKQHWRALKASYQTSPFFEFYEDELKPLYEKKFENLITFNYECLNFIAEALEIDWDIEKTSEYIAVPKDAFDARKLVFSKKRLAPKFDAERYAQVFETKHGFINNLSILDLLFNCGPQTLAYLEAQQLPIFEVSE
ncbi:WbqC family protein [Zunongwangia sp.]|uniref:WbqC family protein n=1 Tax=Zunongwangia sp. TaxID=1965325 RepID=UPI003AA9D9B3